MTSVSDTRALSHCHKANTHGSARHSVRTSCAPSSIFKSPLYHEGEIQISTNDSHLALSSQRAGGPTSTETNATGIGYIASLSQSIK